jgi:hypothetical protein
MQHELRLIEVFDTQGNLLSIITNDLKAPAEEIGQIYRHRWQIELFFKWIKQHLKELLMKKYFALILTLFCLSAIGTITLADGPGRPGPPPPPHERREPPERLEARRILDETQRILDQAERMAHQHGPEQDRLRRLVLKN